MKINFTKLTNLLFGGVIMTVLASCYTFKRTVAPAEVAGNEAFDGRIVVVKTDNNGPQTGLSFFAVRVPANWNVTVDDKSYKQYAAEGTLNDQGEPVNMERAMRYCAHLTNSLNYTNPKEGYTWFAFQTTECIRRALTGSSEHGADSAAFDYKVINDGVEGTYELDYMIGSWEVNDYDKADTLDYEQITFKDMAGSDIYRVGPENAQNVGDNNFNEVNNSFRSTVTVLPGGTPVDNSPKIVAKLNGGTVDVEYKNVVGGISVFKNAATVGCAGMDNFIAPGQNKFNEGAFQLSTAGLEPGVYHVRSLTTDASSSFTVANKEFKADEALFVLGSTNFTKAELVKNGGEAFEASRVLDANLYEQSEEILKAMVDSILKVKPAVVLIAGDLTMAGEKENHEALVEALKAVTDAGIKVLVVPGDKDVNNPKACSYTEGVVNALASVTPAEFAEIYAGFGYGDAVSRDENTLSYVSYPTKNIAVLALDACQYQNNGVEEFTDENGEPATEVVVDENGELSEETIAWAKAAVEAAHATGRQVVALMHHLVSAPFNGYAVLGNVVNNHNKIDLIGSILGGGNDDENGEEMGEEEGTQPQPTEGEGEEEEEEVDEFGTAWVQSALAEMGVDVVFVGDGNGNDIQKVTTEEGKALYQVLTGSAAAYNCPFRLVAVSESGLDIQTRIINNLEVEGLDMPFEDFAYSRTKNDLPILVSTFSEQNWDMIHDFLVKRFTFDYDPEVDIFDKNMFFKIPETAEEGAAIVNNNMIPPLVDVILAFVDGNENLKKSEELVAGMHTGLDGMISGINSLPSIINPIIKEGFAAAGLDLDQMVDNIVGSIAYNFLGEPTNVTNDLFAVIPFSAKYEDTGISSASSNSNAETTIYNIAGQKLQAPAKGINIINGKKVLVK